MFIKEVGLQAIPDYQQVDLFSLHYQSSQHEPGHESDGQTYRLHSNQWLFHLQQEAAHIADFDFPEGSVRLYGVVEGNQITGEFVTHALAYLADGSERPYWSNKNRQRPIIRKLLQNTIGVDLEELEQNPSSALAALANPDNQLFQAKDVRAVVEERKAVQKTYETADYAPDAVVARLTERYATWIDSESVHRKQVYGLDLRRGVMVEDWPLVYRQAVTLRPQAPQDNAQTSSLYRYGYTSTSVANYMKLERLPEEDSYGAWWRQADQLLRQDFPRSISQFEDRLRSSKVTDYNRYIGTLDGNDINTIVNHRLGREDTLG